MARFRLSYAPGVDENIHLFLGKPCTITFLVTTVIGEKTEVEIQTFKGWNLETMGTAFGQALALYQFTSRIISIEIFSVKNKIIN